MIDNSRHSNQQAFEAPSDDEVKRLELERYGISDGPIDVLCTQGNRRRSALKRCHVCLEPLPSNALISIGGKFAVCTPEMCFLQRAKTASVVELIKFGFDICGSYDGYPPLSSRRKIERFLQQASGHKGIKKARVAVRYICDNSASHMESILTMLLCLPPRYGGYGIDAPVLNRKIELPAGAQRIAGKRFFVCDLYWQSAKLDVEYDSDAFHTASDQIANDSKRRAALNSLGIATISITRKTLVIDREFDKLARLIAKALNQRLRIMTKDWAALRAKLRSALFSDFGS